MAQSGVAAIVLAAGRGRRMGQDKALMILGGEPALVRVLRTCRDAGADQLVIVRSRDAAPLPSEVDDLGVPYRVVQVGDGAMTDSIVVGRDALVGEPSAVVIFPVDHAPVAADTVAAVLGAVASGGCAVALPLWRERPGHPVALAWAALNELGDGSTETLRDVVRRDASRVRAVPTNCPWTVRDLDTPADLRAAQGDVLEQGWPVQEQMRRHRSRRKFSGEPVPDAQVARLVDAARHASTSSFIQAYSVVVVSDPERKARCAALCADQEQIRQAPVFLAVCADVSRLARASDDADGVFAAGDFELFVQATVDAALVAQNLQLAGEAEGLGSCMIGAARNHPVELAALLGLPPYVYVVMGLTLGHAVDDPAPRERMPLAGVVHREQYDADASWAAAQGADPLMRNWAREVNKRGAVRGMDESKGWRDRMARLWSREGRYVRSRAGLRQALVRLGMLAGEGSPSGDGSSSH